jgi:NAD(P)-dependent dehydrogenase (short-subunit alcohol dehydrogenase family)
MRAIEAFFSAHAAWDHVVVSAAQTASGPVRTLPLADATAAMESKFWGAYRVARAAEITDGGSLTLVSGYLSVRPSTNAVLQGAINSALEGLARGLALELSPIRVNAISPGTIDTPLWSKMDDAKRKELFAAAAAGLPAKRIGQPDDIAQAAIYLMKTPFATGSTVRVDGGGAIG